MCTLTWWWEDDSYGVLFNRDESVKRGTAESPVIYEEAPCRSIRPTDPDGGGTWIWVNEAGVIACLLNNYTAIKHIPTNPVSRGLLLTSLASVPSVAALKQYVTALDCSSYRGFYLFGYDGRSKTLFIWDGMELSIRAAEEVSCPVTTSGFLPEEVIAYRRNHYQLQVAKRHGSRLSNLETYHTTHNPEFPAHSVLMARPDARTVSHSRIVVDPARIRFSYSPVDLQQRMGPAVLTTLEREN